MRRLYFVTWNVATKYPEQEPDEMLGLGRDGVESLPDFFIVG